MWPFWDSVKHRRFRGKNLKDKGHLEGLGVGGRYNMKIDFEKIEWKCVN